MSDKVLGNLLKDRLFQMDSVSFNHFHSGVILYLSLRKIITEWFTDNHDYTLSQIPKSIRETPGKHIVSELAAISIYTQKMKHPGRTHIIASRLAIIQELLGFALELKLKQLICAKKGEIRKSWPKDGHKLLPIFNMLPKTKKLKLEKLYRDCNVDPIIFDLKIGGPFSDQCVDEMMDLSKLPHMLEMIDKYKMGYEKRFSEFENEGETSYWLSKEFFIFLSKLYLNAKILGVPNIDYRFSIPDVSSAEDLAFVLTISIANKNKGDYIQ